MNISLLSFCVVHWVYPSYDHVFRSPLTRIILYYGNNIKKIDRVVSRIQWKDVLTCKCVQTTRTFVKQNRSVTSRNSFCSNEDFYYTHTHSTQFSDNKRHHNHILKNTQRTCIQFQNSYNLNSKACLSEGDPGAKNRFLVKKSKFRFL